MCDNDSMHDMLAYQLKAGLSRREFGALTLGVGLVSLLPRAADAAEVTEAEVDIKTPDGVCDAYFVHPAKGAARRGAGVAGRLRPAAGVPADGQAPGRVRLCGAGGQSVLPREARADVPAQPGLQRSGDTRCADGADECPDPADCKHRCHGLPGLARRPEGGGQETQGRHDRLLHGRAADHAHRRELSRAASARAPLSMAADWSPTSPTARTC